MKKLILILLILPVLMFGQLSVVSTLPANNAVNVPLQATISMTFSEALDTNVMNSEEIWFSNIDWESAVSYGYSEDLKTSFGVYNLQPNTTYFIACMYAKALSGATMTSPFVYHFTTGSSFSPHSVSGTLLSGTTGVSPERAIVGLMTESLDHDEGRPNFAGWTNVNNDGSFTVPYISNGTYWPVAAKDVDGDGTISPGNGIDAFAFGDSIVINNASVSNVTMTFFSFEMNVVSTEPANHAVNVPLQATISMTFDQPIDTFAMNSEYLFFTNIDWDDMVSSEYSPDLKTSTAVVNLQPNTSYFIALMHARSQYWARMTEPYVFYFTTGPSFPTPTVSGTVISGTSGVSPEHAVVGLMKRSIFESEGEPEFVAWANVNSNGTFTIPYVSNGTYWPLAAKDVDKDGVINPEQGDAIAFSDSIIVNNASVSGIMLEFIDNTPKTYHQALVIADSMAALHLPADKVLRYVNSWGVDTLGRGLGTWHFWYSGNNDTIVYDVPGSKFEGGIDSTNDPWQVSWVTSHKPLNNHALAAPSSTVIMNTENAGGRDFRNMPVPIEAHGDIEMVLGDHSAGEFHHNVPDTNLIYWSVRYIWEIDYEPWIMNGRKFLCDFSSGAVLLNQTMSVTQKANAPLTFELMQNYPNPFNPTTTITFTVPARGQAVVKVYNMLGQEVATLFNGEAMAGTYTSVHFNASGLASGLYIARLEYGGQMQMKKMMLLK